MGCTASSDSACATDPLRAKLASRESEPGTRPSSPAGLGPTVNSAMTATDNASPLDPSSPVFLKDGGEMQGVPAPVPATAQFQGSVSGGGGGGAGNMLACAPVDIACTLLRWCAGWSERAALATLNVHWRTAVFRDGATWRALCEMLHREQYIYSPPVCVAATWRDMFFELYALRGRWAAAPPALGSPSAEEERASKVCYTVAELLTRQKAGETGLEIVPMWKKEAEEFCFNISVHVRLRPARAKADDAGAEAVDVLEEVTLPLHQRLALVKKQRGCTTSEAFAFIFGTSDGDFFEGAALSEEDGSGGGSDGQGAAAAAAAAQVAATAGGSSNATVGVSAAAAAGVVSVSPQEIVMCAPGVGLRPFRCFDTVLGETASQAAVYEAVARRQVMDFINVRTHARALSAPPPWLPCHAMPASSSGASHNGWLTRTTGVRHDDMHMTGSQLYALLLRPDRLWQDTHAVR
jgi:hypothetical protein